MKLRLPTDDSEKSLAPFFSPPVISATVYSLVIVSGLVLLFWPREPLLFYIRSGTGPLLFFQTFAATLIILSYLNLRCGRGELIKADYMYQFQKEKTVREKENPFLQYGLWVFLVHTFFMLAPFLPPLMLASSISGISPLSFFEALTVLFTAALLSRFFSFLVYLLLGRASVLGYLLIRGFAVFYLFATAGFAPVFNPLRMIHELNKNDPHPELYSFYMVASLFSMLILGSVSALMVRRHIRMENKM